MKNNRIEFKPIIGPLDIITVLRLNRFKNGNKQTLFIVYIKSSQTLNSESIDEKFTMLLKRNGFDCAYEVNELIYKYGQVEEIIDRFDIGYSEILKLSLDSPNSDPEDYILELPIYLTRSDNLNNHQKETIEIIVSKEQMLFFLQNFKAFEAPNCTN